MRIILVGMSNCGKSHWSNQLRDQCGYRIISCDGLIEDELQLRYPTFKFQGVDSLGSWMGFPYQSEYVARSKEYLSIEEVVTNQGLDELLGMPEESNIVLDTTGSVVHLTESTKTRIKSFPHVAYLALPHNHEQLLSAYISNPRPVVWGECFFNDLSIGPQEAVKQSYSKLLNFRDSKYRELSSTQIEYDQHRATGLSAQQFISMVR